MFAESNDDPKKGAADVEEEEEKEDKEEKERYEMVANEAEDWHLARYLRAERPETETTPMKAELAEEEARYQESPVDANEWQREYRRVRERLKEPSKSEGGHYLTHLHALSKLFQQLKDILEIAGTATVNTYVFVCDQALTTIATHERRLNNSVPPDLVLYRGESWVDCCNEL